MRLLLDEMHAATIAHVLTSEGHDVLAVTAVLELRGIPDTELLEYAASVSRAVVTENIEDFAMLCARWAAEARSHAGVMLTSPGRFNRASLAYPGNLLHALRQFVRDPPVDGESWTWWL